jgi:ABC-type bacteriocin/lantibiotic exporter with double-glycine peptidase domain
MKANDIYWILKIVTDYFNVDFNISRLQGKNIYGFEGSDDENPANSFVNYITDLSAPFDISILKYELSDDELEDFFNDLTSPVLLFKKNELKPLIITNVKAGNAVVYLDEEKVELIQIADLKDLFYKKDGKYLLLSFFPVTSLFSDTDHPEDITNSLIGSPIRRLFRLLHIERKDIGYIYVYAVMAGLVYLSLPLGIQAIIGLIMSGQVSTSVVVLVSFVLLGILINGGLQVMQISMIEYLQRRLFTKAAFEFSYRIPKIKLEAILKEYAPELMNRFFDILSVQKGLSKLLMDFTTATLQIFFGIFLLAFYHPFFIFFGFLLLIVLAIIIWLTGPKGLETSLTTSKYKYKVAHWLEEMARTVNTFKLAGFTNLPLEKTDQVMNSYLIARKRHFKILIFQYSNIIGFKMLVTGGLLILGSMLVINREINIGQFVAAEIIIILVINAVEKMIMSIDVIYDILTAVEKLGTVTDLPLEESQGLYVHQFSKNHEGLSLKTNNLQYQFPDMNKDILSGINLDIKKSERICISGYNGSGKSTLIYVLCGLYSSYRGEISYDNVSLKDININSLRWHIGDNLSHEDLFEGTLMENITLGRENIPLEDIVWATESVGLGLYIRFLNDGLHHNIIAGGKGLPGSIIKKIVLARSIVHRPKLLILDDHNLNIEKTEKRRILEFIYDRKFSWTIINISNDPFVMKLSDKVAILKDGGIVVEGGYNEIQDNFHYKDLISN